MPAQQFETSQGLLEDVMTKQAGSVPKAVLEAVMNSVDANGENIEVWIEEDFIEISDDGDGLDIEEILTYFKRFGLKDDDIEEKEFGRFRMGRGQIFNFGRNLWHSQDNLMVIDLDNDETWVHENIHNGPKTVDGEDLAEIVREDTEEVENMSGGEVESEVSILDSEGLSFNVLEHINTTEGCTIQVDLYNDVSVSSTVNEVKKLVQFIPWVHDVNLTVNEDVINREPGEVIESEHAWFCFDASDSIPGVNPYNTNTLIYNKGAFVKKETLSKTNSLIISKVDLDVNFARNDILDTDEIWDDIKTSFNVALVNHLLEKDNNDVSVSERIWMLERAAESDVILTALSDVPLIEDINSNLYSVQTLSEESVTFTHSRNDQAKKLMDDSGVIFIKNNFEKALKNLIDSSNIMSYGDAVQDQSSFEMSHIEDDSLSKKRSKNLERARWFLDQCDFDGEVKAGFSRHADIWKDDENVVYIHKGTLKTAKNEFIVVVLEEALREASFEGSTMESAEENFSFRRNYSRLSEDKGEFQLKLLNNDVYLPV